MSFDILFLGTGAADRMHLEQEKDFADKDKRRCAAALLNGHVLLDCGPHILNALTAAQISLENITDILVTHLHPDHFCVSCVEEIAKANPKVKIWVRSDAEVNLSFECCVEKMVCFNEYTVGELKVASAPANHAAFPQHFSIECDSKKIFYGLDGAWFLGDTVRFMKNQKYNNLQCFLYRLYNLQMICHKPRTLLFLTILLFYLHHNYHQETVFLQ